MLFAFQLKAQVPIHDTWNATTIPIVYNRFIYIQAKADGVSGNFVFDTGADNLYFDSIFYSQHNFKHSNFTFSKLGGAGKNPQRVKMILDTVSVLFGNQEYKTSVVPILKLKSITGDYADGILGLKSCLNSVLEINYQKQFMRIHPDTDSIDLSQFCKIDFEFKNDRIIIPLSVKINDTIHVTGDFLVDLGMAGAVVMNGAVANKYNLTNAITDKVFTYSMRGGWEEKHQDILFLQTLV